MIKKIPVVELRRVSTADQANSDRAGLDRQIEVNSSTIKAFNLEVVEVFTLIDVSGTATAYTPEIQKILQMIGSGQVYGVVIADLDRLFRPDDFASYGILQPIKDAKALLYVNNQAIDLNEDNGVLYTGILSMIAGFELAQFKKRVAGAKEEKRKQGKNPNSEITLPMGVKYNRKTEQYYYDDIDSGRVRELFKLVCAEEIHNKAELERRTGIQQRTISNLLKNELYIGYRHYTEKRDSQKQFKADGRQSDKKKVPRKEHEIIRVKVIDEPLVNEEVFWKVQEIFSNINTTFTEKRKDASNLFLFKKHLYCAHCGSPMYTVPGGKAGSSKDYYYCRNLNSNFIKKNGGKICNSHYLRRKDVENMINNYISDLLSNRECIIQSLDSLTNNNLEKQNEKELARLAKQIKNLETKRKKAISLNVDSKITDEEFDNVAKGINEELTLLRRKRTALQHKRNPMTPKEVESIADLISNSFSLFKYWDRCEKINFLSQINPKFWITDHQVQGFSLGIKSEVWKPYGQGFIAATSITSAG